MTEAPVRALVIAGMLTAGGAEKQLAYHVRCLVAAGVEVVLVSLDGPGHYGSQLAGLVREFICVDESWGRLGRMARLASIAKRFAPDIVQATHTFANLYAVVAARACGALSVGALRVDLRTSRESNGWFARWHLTGPDVVVANSTLAAEDLRRSLRPGDFGVYVLENALELDVIDRSQEPRDTLRRIAGASPDDVLVLGVGTVRGDKAFDAFARVIERAHTRAPRLRGVIIGDGPDLPRLELMRTQSPVMHEGLTLAGRHGDAFRLMAGADLFLLTSLNEGVPNVLIEAMAAGLPAVVTPAGDSGLLVHAARSGEVHDFGDEEGMANSLVALAASAERRMALGARARRFAESQLDFRHLWPRMERIYLDAARRTGRDDLARRIARLGGSVAPTEPAQMPGAQPVAAGSTFASDSTGSGS